MNELNTIQTLSKIAKVVSNVIFVCAIVGACLSAAGILSLAFGLEGFKLGGVTITSILQDKAALSEGTLYARMAESIIYCIVYGVLSKVSMNYFKRELADGTPFTVDGAKALLRLGILSICIPLAGQILYAIAQSILTKALPDVAPSETDTIGSVSIGIALIVISLLCRYGAELRREKETAETRHSVGSDDRPVQ